MQSTPMGRLCNRCETQIVEFIQLVLGLYCSAVGGVKIKAGLSDPQGPSLWTWTTTTPYGLPLAYSSNLLDMIFSTSFAFSDSRGVSEAGEARCILFLYSLVSN